VSEENNELVQASYCEHYYADSVNQADRACNKVVGEYFSSSPASAQTSTSLYEKSFVIKFSSSKVIRSFYIFNEVDTATSSYPNVDVLAFTTPTSLAALDGDLRYVCASNVAAHGAYNCARPIRSKNFAIAPVSGTTAVYTHLREIRMFTKRDLA
jgi:hypothetical protein